MDCSMNVVSKKHLIQYKNLHTDINITSIYTSIFQAVTSSEVGTFCYVLCRCCMKIVKLHDSMILAYVK